MFIHEKFLFSQRLIADFCLGSAVGNDDRIWLDRHSLEVNERDIEGICHRFVGDSTVYDVHRVCQAWVLADGLTKSFIGNSQDVWKRHVAQSVSACSSNSTRHVCHTIVHDSVDNVGWIGMSCWARRFCAASLIDADIDNHGTRLHQLQVVGGHQHWSTRAWNQHAANHQICSP